MAEYRDTEELYVGVGPLNDNHIEFASTDGTSGVITSDGAELDSGSPENYLDRFDNRALLNRAALEVGCITYEEFKLNERDLIKRCRRHQHAYSNLMRRLLDT